LSHPFDFVEGSGLYVSTIRRCEHGVYRPSFSVDSDPNPVCSICQMPIATKQTKKECKELKSRNSLLRPDDEIEEEKDVEELQTYQERFAAQPGEGVFDEQSC
jgi:hypothetical protein